MPRRVVILPIYNHANITSWGLCEIFDVKFRNLTKIIRYTITLPINSQVPYFKSRPYVEPPGRTHWQNFLFLAFGGRLSSCSALVETQECYQAKIMTNTTLFLVKENSNPRQEFGILIFSPQ